MIESPRVRRAIISVSDKLGLVDFASGLQQLGITIYSTGGTRRHLLENGIEAKDIAEYTGFPEMMDGRVKTLNPKIFGGILARRDCIEHLNAMQDHDMLGFELVAVNLYPFQATISRAGVSQAEAIEQIDIGGPSLIRAAAKNHDFVTVATRPDQYSAILAELQESGATTQRLRQRLAQECFAMTAEYDQSISAYLASEFLEDSSSVDSLFPQKLSLGLERKSVLRYGENPHQKASVYRLPNVRKASLLNSRQINGKEISYNNLLDLDAALSIVRGFSMPAAAVIKHNNPCGAATSHRLFRACQKALEGDPVSAFGSVIGFNSTVDVDTAQILCEPGNFIEAIVAPDFEAGAVGLLTTKPKWKENVRLMQVGQIDSLSDELNYRFVSGGILVQQTDGLPSVSSDWVTPTEAKVARELQVDLEFAWEMVRHVKSNAIVLAHDTHLVGVGAGQMSRVDSVEIAIQKAGARAGGSVLASDAFFPFPDSIERAAKAGIVAIIQPGGSKRDDEVVEACNQHKLPMVFTGRRHFKH